MSLSKIINENERWLKTAVCVSHHLKNALLQILFNRQEDPNYKGLPEDEEELYKELLRFKPQLDSLIKKRVLKQDQYDIIYPNDKKTFFSKFDINIIALLIRNCQILQPPIAGWENALLPHDTSISANVMRAKIIRNLIFHYADPSAMDEAEFQKFWSDIASILQALKYHEDISDIQQGNFDPYPMEVLKSRLIYLEEKHDRFKHDTGKELIEINNKICDIKEILSKKPNEEDLKVITSKMDLLFNMINKEMERKDAGKNLYLFHVYFHICGLLGSSVFSFLYIKIHIFSHCNIVYC